MSGLSLEYLQSLEGVAGGLATLDSSTGALLAAQIPATVATLDSSGTLTASQIPASLLSASSPFKGEFATQAALLAAQPTGALGDYAYVDSTNSFWYWNAGLTAADTVAYTTPGVPQWVNQQITAANYALITSTSGLNMVPYIIAVSAPLVG